MTKKFLFEDDGRYSYGFTNRGLFTLLNKNGEPLYNTVIPLIYKLGSHLLWILIWFIGLFFLDFPRLFTSLIIFHLFLFGCRLTALLLKGGFFPLLFPPLWMRLTKRLYRGEGFELLKRYNLERHPGLLVNLARAQLGRDQQEEGLKTLQTAYAYSDHPAIGQMLEYLTSSGI